MRRLLSLVIVLVTACPAAPAPSADPRRPPPAPPPEPAKPAAPSSIDATVAGARALPGLFKLYWDDRAGKLWLEIDQWQRESLYQSSLPAGVGSNDIGLDRGQLGATRVVRVERVGPKVLLIQSNLGFPATRAPPDAQGAARDSFAESALWGFTVAAEAGGRALVDATEFFLRDAHDIPAALKRT